MKRQTQDLATRVYSYGTVPSRIAPVGGEDAANGQLRLAHRLWNTLVAIERARETRYRIIMRDDEQAEIERLTERLKELRTAVSAAKKLARKRSVDLGDMPEEIEAIRADVRARIDRRKERSAELHAARKAELDALSEKTKARIKRARQAAGRMGLYWGTYNDIVQRADAGRKLGKLQFRRWHDDGTLTAQIIGGTLPTKCVAGQHTFFRIDPATTGQKWRYAHMRIGSTASLDPIWLSIPIVYHREIPVASLIKSVSMTRRGGKWQINVTVTMPRPAERVGLRRIAVDIGWRLRPDGGVRVGYWADHLGDHGEIAVCASDLAQFAKVAELRSVCDRMRDEFLPSLAAWCDGSALTEEWRTQTRALIQWRSTDRLATLIRWWGDHRIDGDEEMFAAAQEWRRQYLHLASWWRNLEDQMRGRIKEHYRMWAAAVARDYDEVVIEAFDLREVIQIPAPESTEIVIGTYRQMISPSVFRACLLNAARREGLRVVIVPAEFTTMECHCCQAIEKWDQASDLTHRCGQCGAVWDQDHNAALNLLAASGQVTITANQQDSGPNEPTERDRSPISPQVIEMAGATQAALEVVAQHLGS